MKTLLAALVGATMLSAPGLAQDDQGAAARGALCSQVADSLARLTCFDNAFPKTSSAEPNTDAAAPESTSA